MERGETPWGYDRNQAEFDHQGGLVILIIKWLFKLVIYLPLIMVGYLFVKPFTEANTTTWKWILLIGIFTLLQLSVIYELKVWMRVLKARGNEWWIVIFLFLLSYCCVFSAWVMYEPCRQLAGSVFSGINGEAVVWGVTLIFIAINYRNCVA